MFMLSRILWAGLEVVSVVVHHVVGSVPVAHHVHVVSPGGVTVGLVPGISLGLGLSRSLVIEGSVLSVAGPVVHVIVHVVVHVVVVHGPVVSKVGVAVGSVESLSLRLGLSLSLVEGLVPVSLMTVHVVHLPVFFNPVAGPVPEHVVHVVAVHHVVAPVVGVAVGAVPGISLSLGSCQGSETDHDGDLDHSSSIALN